MNAWTRGDRWWTAANGVGVIAFLALASLSWIEPQVRDVPCASAGDGVVWALTALPVLLAFIIADLMWLGFAVHRSASRNDLRAMLPWSITVATWLLAFVFDGLHHGA